MNNSSALVVELILAIIAIASMWTLFSKAGKPGWAAIIPFYNVYVLLQIVGRPGWWLILFFIPIVNFIVAIIVYIEFAQVFGKGTGFGCLMILFPYIMLPILAFTDTRYEGPIAH
jgi:hypothetical protein